MRMDYSNYNAVIFKTKQKMITHEQLYSLANTLGWLAMLTIVGYHVIAVNGKQMSGGEQVIE